MNQKTLIIALFLIALAPTAVGQNQADPTVEVTITEGQGTATVDAAAWYNITVENTSPASPTGQDPPMPVVIDVEGGAPGWQVTVRPTQMELAPGEVGYANMTVGVTTAATEETMVFTVVATITNPANSVVNPTGQDLQGADRAEVTVHRAEGQSVLVDNVNNYVWYIGGGGVLIAIVATGAMVYQLRNPIDLKTDEISRVVKRGKGVQFPFTVKNRSAATNILFHVDADLDGWGAFLLVPELRLDKGDEAEMELMVTAPETAEKGETLHVTVFGYTGAEKRGEKLFFEAIAD